ncbi:ATP-binding protein [Streptomyces sp. NPDC051018]|uniref:ATP-binding protein n=1 Tax=Streptomyces sp. NPDC051018 TaxID=3365639 RepID=UPI003789CB83
MRRTHRDSSSSDAHPHPAPAVRGALPAGPGRFVGRAGELAELTRLLGASRLVTISGAGGVGKSRLAAEGASALQNRYADGVRPVGLTAVGDPGLLEHSLAEALGIIDRTTRPPREVLLGHLARRDLLLVLDGVEQFSDACAALVRELLRGAPGLRVLAVGRTPLRIEGEAVLSLGPLTEADAVEFFCDRAAVVVPGFRPAEDDRAAVRELCLRLDGIPLALELAARRLPALSVEQVVERLDERFRLLAGGEQGSLPRHRTLRTAIGWSHELCTPEERLLWARLSVFAGPFDLEAVEYVCSGPDLPADRVPDVVAELLALSVITREETPAGVRYRMPGTLRACGEEWLGALGDARRMRKRHRDWYVGLATWCELDWFSPRQTEVAACAESALPNLRAALELCLESEEDTHLGQYLAGTLWFCWVGCGRLAEGRRWLDRALAQGDEHEEARLRALWVLGHVAILQGDTETAAGALRTCREEAVRADSPAAVYAVHRMGTLALLADESPRAEELLRTALDSYRELGELNGHVLMGQVELAMALVFQDRLPEAVVLCEEVREICGEHGELWTRAYALYVLAYAAWTDDSQGTARELLAEAIAISRRFHDLLGLVLAIELMALVTADEGDPAEAAVLQGAAAPLWDGVGPPLLGSRHFGAPSALCRRKAREALGPWRYEVLVREGRGLSPEAAVRRALAGPDSRTGLEDGRPAAGPALSQTREPAGSPTGKDGETAG